MRSSKAGIAAVAVFCAGMLTGCVSVQSNAFPLGAQKRPAKAADAVIGVFREAPPERPFARVARLNVHIEKTFFIPSAFDDARPQLEKLARQQGADAIIEIKETKSRLNETFIYNVAATAIVFTP